MIKDLDQTYRNINDIYDNISYDLYPAQSNENKKVFSTTIESQFFKGHAHVTGTIETNGLITVCFTFGEVTETPRLFQLMNDFNFYAMWAKAYIGTIGGKRHLEIRYANAYELDDEQAVALFKHYFDDLLSDSLVGRLTPLVGLTK